MSQVIEVVERYIVPDIPQIELPTEDGIPLESHKHRIQINLLIELTRRRWQGRTDFFTGGNMFIYFSLQQARNKDYKGPDFFVVKGVDGARERKVWVVWEEDGHLPNVIVELLSPSTAAEDLTTKKDLYESRLRIPEYICYDPDTDTLQGWHLAEWLAYVPLIPNERGHLYSAQLDAWLGLWHGVYQGMTTHWLRLFAADGTLIPTTEEAEEHERQRAEAAEAEVARLRAELERLSHSAKEA
jgi:Uma2 family endonuclease